MKKITIDDIVLAAFKKMDSVFRGYTLIEAVKENIETAKTYDSTILRSLRKLRSRGKINYEIADHNKSIYRKKKVPANINTQIIEGAKIISNGTISAKDIYPVEIACS